MKNSSVRQIAMAALFIAIGLVMPFLTGQVPSIGNALLPMHIPVLVAGYACKSRYALAVGFITPLLRSLIFGMPPLFPTAVAMAFELAAYGFLTGIFYLCFSGKLSKIVSIYASLILAMLAGRAVWGVVTMLLVGAQGGFSFALFLQGAFLSAIPGIILQLVLIPVLVIGLERAKVIRND